MTRCVWVRGVGMGVKDTVPGYFCGWCDREDEGQVGFDVKFRPAFLGEGEYTCVVGGDAVEWPDGEPDGQTR